MENFNKSIKRIIKKFEYDFFLIQQDFEVKCSCHDFSTKQGVPSCEKCLGTGYKIKIRKIRGASEDRKITYRNLGLEERSVGYTYFIDEKYPIYEDNIIVDKDLVLVAYRVERSKTNEPVYSKCLAVQKKSDSKMLLRMFKKIVK